MPDVTIPPDGPSLYYASTDGLVYRLDAPRPGMFNPRERALCNALLDFARECLGNPLLDMARPVSDA